jgi:hypothetical protein
MAELQQTLNNVFSSSSSLYFYTGTPQTQRRKGRRRSKQALET